MKLKFPKLILYLIFIFFITFMFAKNIKADIIFNYPQASSSVYGFYFSDGPAYFFPLLFCGSLDIYTYKTSLAEKWGLLISTYWLINFIPGLGESSIIENSTAFFNHIFIGISFSLGIGPDSIFYLHDDKENPPMLISIGVELLTTISSFYLQTINLCTKIKVRKVEITIGLYINNITGFLLRSSEVSDLNFYWYFEATVKNIILSF